MRLLRYYKLYDWMISELGLNSDSGIVAVVYSFSEIGKPCTLSYTQFAELLHVSRRKAIDRVSHLVKAGYLSCECHGTKQNCYIVNLCRFSASDEKVTSTSDEKVTSTSDEKVTSTSDEKVTSTSDEKVTSLVTETSPDTINRELTKSLTERVTEFSAPSLREVQQYFAEIGCRDGADRFCDYYTARGWQGVKDWKALARVWCSRSRGFGSSSGKSGKSSIDVAALQAQLDAKGVI